MTKHKHVIVGGGFGGLRVARLLANRDDVDVIVVNPQASFEYHGSLYRSANGYSPLETVIPYREIFKDTNIQYAQDFMVDIDPASKCIKLLSGHEIFYDSATLALGYEPEYFGIPGMREFSKSLYSLADALALRKALTSLAQHNFNKTAPANVVVAGGGPTGIEVAASVARFFQLITGDSRVVVSLVEAQDRVLKALPTILAESVVQTLDSHVRIICNQKVIRASKENLHMADGSTVPHDLLIWTAGSSANSYFRQRQDLFEVDGKGRVMVDQSLQTRHESLYVIGDSASVQYSGTAHAALEMGSYVAKNVISKLEHNDGSDYENYMPTQPDYAVPTAYNAAVAMRGDTLLIGSDGWKVRRDLDLSALMLVASESVAKSHWKKGEILAKLSTA